MMGSLKLPVAVALLALLFPVAAHLRAQHRANGGNAALSADAAAARTSNSLGEVVTLLQTMLKEFADAAIEDRENWEAYSKWSQDLETEKRGFIQEQEALVMSKTALKNANIDLVQKLTADLAQLTTDIGETQKSIAELVKMRHEEHQQFEISLTDVTQTINAVSKATTILEGHYGASPAVLAAVRQRVQMALVTYGHMLKKVVPNANNVFSALLQQANSGQNPDFLNTDGNSAYGSYEKQGGAGGVLGMLADLQSQLEGQRQQLIATENEAQLQYESTKATKDAELANLKNEKSEKEERKAGAEATIEQCTATIDQANKEIGEAQGVIEVTLADRATFQKEFGERTAARTQEQAATQAALDALQSVSAGAKDGVGAAAAAASFLQVNLASKLSAKAHAHLQKTLKSLVALGKELKSTELVKMSQDYMSSEQTQHFDESNFGPVLKLLRDLIERLESEAAAETSQHEWCETEKEQSVKSKEEREKIIHELQGTIESLTTNIAQLKTEVEFLVSEIERVTEETRIAKEIRAQELALYQRARADHEEVIKAIGQALAALSGQYGFIQLSQHKQSPFSSYSSGSAGAGSAMEMLEDLNHRYGEALRQIIADEESAVAAHEDLLKRNAQFLEDCTNTKNMKISERRGLINDLGDDKAEMKTNLIELHQVGKYLMDLRPSCDDIRSTFEERTKRREAEIAALREALTVISDPSMA